MSFPPTFPSIIDVTQVLFFLRCLPSLSGCCPCSLLFVYPVIRREIFNTVRQQQVLLLFIGKYTIFIPDPGNVRKKKKVLTKRELNLFYL